MTDATPPPPRHAPPRARMCACARMCICMPRVCVRVRRVCVHASTHMFAYGWASGMAFVQKLRRLGHCWGLRVVRVCGVPERNPQTWTTSQELEVLLFCASSPCANGSIGFSPLGGCVRQGFGGRTDGAYAPSTCKVNAVLISESGRGARCKKQGT